MSKLIAVWGSPNSGKTTLSVKLAGVLANRTKEAVVVLHPDLTVPVISLLFPQLKKDKLHSLSAAMSQVNITQADVLGSMMLAPHKENLGFLGFKNTENKYTCPAFSLDKSKALLSVLQEISGYVLVDCTCTDDPITRAALMTADQTLRLTTPELQSAVYFSSQLPVYSDPAFHSDQDTVFLSMTQKANFPPAQEIERQSGKIVYTVPYAQSVRDQLQNGALLEPVKDRPYRLALEKIAGFIL